MTIAIATGADIASRDGAGRDATTLDARTAGFIALGALAARGIYIAVFLRNYEPRSDALQYHELATSVSRGHGLSTTFPFWYEHATAFRPPLFPALLGALYTLTNHTLLSGMLVNVGVGTAVAVLAAYLATDLAGRTAGIVAGLAVAVMPSLIANDVVPLTESLSLALLLVVLLFLERGHDLRAAVACGLLTLTRPSAQAFALVLAAWMVHRFGWWRAARFVVVVVLCVTPWVIRNWTEVGTAQLVTSNGFNLAFGYSDVAHARHDFVDPFLDPAFAGVRRVHATEATLDATLRSTTITEVRNAPGRILQVTGRNMLRWFELTPGRNRNAERLDGRNLGFRNATLPVFYVVTALGVTGLVLHRRRTVAVLLLCSMAYFTVVSIITVAPPRLRAPFDLACCIGLGALVATWRGRAAAAPEHSPERSRAGRSTQVAIALGAVVVLGAAALVAHGRVEHAAKTALRRALARDAPAAAQLAGAYPVATNAKSLPYTGDALTRAERLSGRLLDVSSRLPRREGHAAQRAGEALHDADHEFQSLVLLQLAITHAKPAPSFRVAQLQPQYDRLRASEPWLPAWPAVLDGATARDALARVEHLR